MPPLACMRMTIAAMSTVTWAMISGDDGISRRRMAIAEMTANTRYPAPVAANSAG